MSKKNSNNKTKWLLIGGGAVLAASLAIGLGVHFGIPTTTAPTTPTTNSPIIPVDKTNDFVSAMIESSKSINANTELTDAQKSEALDRKEYQLIDVNKVYCSDAIDLASTNTKLNTFIDAYQEKQTFLIKPHSISSTQGVKKTFSHYRTKTNVELNCWNVETSTFPSQTVDLTTDITSKVAKVSSNIYKKTKDDLVKTPTDATTIWEWQKKSITDIIEETSIYCYFSDYSLDDAKTALNSVISGYTLKPPTTGKSKHIETTFHFKNKDHDITTEAYCWKVVPDVPEETS